MSVKQHTVEVPQVEYVDEASTISMSGCNFLLSVGLAGTG